MKALQALQVPDVDLLLVLQTGALLQHSGKGLPLIDALCKDECRHTNWIAASQRFWQFFKDFRGKRNVHHDTSTIENVA